MIYATTEVEDNFTIFGYYIIQSLILCCTFNVNMRKWKCDHCHKVVEKDSFLDVIKESWDESTIHSWHNHILQIYYDYY
jgi:hypothetical protein